MKVTLYTTNVYSMKTSHGRYKTKELINKPKRKSNLQENYKKLATVPMHRHANAKGIYMHVHLKEEVVNQ